MAYAMDKDELLEATARLTPQWMAGFFDGEGCVSSGWFTGREIPTPRLVVAIQQAEPSIIALIALKYGGHFRQTPKKTGRMYYRVEWIGRDAIPFLDAIKDHVICKRRQVLDGLELVNLLRPVSELDFGKTARTSEEDQKKRTDLVNKIKAANHEIDSRMVADRED